jgi:hypothetical protein
MDVSGQFHALTALCPYPVDRKRDGTQSRFRRCAEQLMPGVTIPTELPRLRAQHDLRKKGGVEPSDGDVKKYVTTL